MKTLSKEDSNQTLISDASSNCMFPPLITSLSQLGFLLFVSVHARNF